MPREDRAVILDADLALDGRREQITQNAQHRRHSTHAQQHQIMLRLHLNADDVVFGRQQRVDERQHTARSHAAQHAAHSALHGLVGADDRSQLVPAERTARKVGRGVAAPGKAEDQQNEINRVIAIFCEGQHPL